MSRIEDLNIVRLGAAASPGTPTVKDDYDALARPVLKIT